jgi:DNA-binding beta-propeller fold protein YncE
LIITSDGQYLLVADTGNDEIKILQPGSLKILGQFGTGYLKSPRSIKIDKYGKILVIDDENKRVTSFSFKGVFKNDTVNVKVIEKRNNVKMMQTSTKSASDASGQSYVVNSPKNQIKIFKKSGALIGIYRAEGMKTPMAVETIGLYFWKADTGNNRILLLKAPRQLEP